MWWAESVALPGENILSPGPLGFHFFEAICWATFQHVKMQRERDRDRGGQERGERGRGGQRCQEQAETSVHLPGGGLVGGTEVYLFPSQVHR